MFICAYIHDTPFLYTYAWYARHLALLYILAGCIWQPWILMSTSYSLNLGDLTVTDQSTQQILPWWSECSRSLDTAVALPPNSPPNWLSRSLLLLVSISQFCYVYHSLYCVVLMLSVHTWCTIPLRMYVAVAFPYPPDRGATGWYQSLGSNILSTTSWQINDVLIYSWRAWVLNIHSNRKYGVIYSFLAIFSLYPETLLSFQLLPIILSTNSDMEGRRTRNGPGTSYVSSSGDSDNMMRVLHGMMESKHQQTELLRQVLLTTPREQRPNSVSDFRRLQPAIFSGTEKLLNAEQWLIDTIDLLKAAQILDENQVEVVKIQLKNVAKTW